MVTLVTHDTGSVCSRGMLCEASEQLQKEIHSTDPQGAGVRLCPQCQHLSSLGKQLLSHPALVEAESQTTRQTQCEPSYPSRASRWVLSHPPNHHECAEKHSITKWKWYLVTKSKTIQEQT